MPYIKICIAVSKENLFSVSTHFYLYLKGFRVAKSALGICPR